MKILYTNANSLLNKVTELTVMSESYNVQVICITETWLNADILDAEVTIPNFNIFREDRSNGTRYGGSAIYVHKSLKVERLDWFNGLESLAVNIVTESIRFNVVCLYRSTSLVDIRDNSELLKALDSLPVGGWSTQFYPIMPMPILRFECGIGINWHKLAHFL